MFEDEGRRHIALARSRALARARALKMAFSVLMHREDKRMQYLIRVHTLKHNEELPFKRSKELKF